jgi:hypothetical protein
LFDSASQLKRHNDHGCHISKDGAVEVVPTINVPIQFKNANNLKTRHHPCAIYADFESSLVPMDQQSDDLQNFAPKSAIMVHDFLSYCFYQLIWTEDHGDQVFKKVCEVRKPGETLVQFRARFSKDIKDCSEEAHRHLNVNNLAILTPEQKDQHWKIKNCCICKEKFKFSDKVRHHHHEHSTAKYLGPAHPHCNLTCNDWNFTNPVFFHNLKGYDAHHILLGCGKDVLNAGAHNVEDVLTQLTKDDLFDGKFTTISESAERHKEITWKPDYSHLQTETHQKPRITIKFKDSMAFLDGSLANLVESLRKTEMTLNDAPNRNGGVKRFTDLFPTLRSYVADLPMKNRTRSTVKVGVELLKQKGIYCYDYVNSPQALDVDHLPSIEDFYNKLTNTACKPADYSHAQKVWDYFGCKTLRDYHDIYLNTDVALLADVFQHFRSMCLKYYKLDPAGCYMSSPQMFWDAMLKFTGVKLDVLTDHEMYLFFEKSKRGGTTFMNEQYATANNKYIPNHDPDKPSNYLLYLDANNLYGHAMSQILPFGNFKWVHSKHLATLHKLEIKSDSPTGYTLEVDMHLPRERHEALKDFPPVCERTTIPVEDLSPFDEKCNRDPLKPQTMNTDKLVNHLAPVKKYVINLYALQHLKKLGYKVTKVHRAVSFKQSFWLRDYISFNSKKRQEAKNAGNDLMSTFFKLANNAVFGKTMENVRNHGSSKFAYNQSTAYNLFTDSAFQSSSIINENLVHVQLHNKLVKLNKPIYVGMTILDYSKADISGFYHNKMKPFYADNVNLLYTDTDSLVLDITTDDVFEDLQHPDLNSEFDFHKSKRNHNDVPPMTVGKMKLEYGPDQHLEEWVGVTNKVYAVKVAESSTVKTTSKGFRMANSQEALETYKDAVFTKTHKTVPVTSIQSKNQRIFTLQQTKIGANPSFGGKRYALEPDHVNRRYTSVPFGYNPL